MPVLTPSAKQQFTDNAGNLAAGFKLYTYAAGTTNPQTTWQDRTGASANTNPIILDSRGEATIYLDESLTYDFVLKTAADAQVWTRAGVQDGAYIVLENLASTASGKGAELVGFKQFGAGAVDQNLGEKAGEDVSVKDYGAAGDGIASNASPSFSAAVSAISTVGGGTLNLLAKSYLLQVAGNPGLTIDAPNVAEPGNAIALRGKGAASSIILSGTSGQYAVKLIGGTAVDAHGYESHADFSVMAATSGANGLHLFNKALTSIENVTIQGCGTALKLESVLSSSFRNITLRNNSVYGAHLLKGAGISGVNASTFDSCNFQSNVALGLLSQSFITDTTFINCNFEANGRQGQASEGGCALVFDGSEGGGGAQFIGGYFESNAGGADLFLSNSGAEYVTVVLVGVTFNRNIAATYVTNCIQTSGKIRLVTIGCAFRSYNGYTPDSGRKYIAGDASLVWEDYGSVMQDAVEHPTVSPMSDRISFAGSVTAAGASLRLPPSWSCSKLGTGSYRVTHNLGVTSVNDYAVSATTSGGGTSFVLSLAKSANSFDLTTVNPSFSNTDAQFDFTLTRL